MAKFFCLKYLRNISKNCRRAPLKHPELFQDCFGFVLLQYQTNGSTKLEMNSTDLALNHRTCESFFEVIRGHELQFFLNFKSFLDTNFCWPGLKEANLRKNCA